MHYQGTIYDTVILLKMRLLVAIPCHQIQTFDLIFWYMVTFIVYITLFVWNLCIIYCATHFLPSTCTWYVPVLFHVKGVSVFLLVRCMHFNAKIELIFSFVYFINQTSYVFISALGFVSINVGNLDDAMQIFNNILAVRKLCFS